MNNPTSATTEQDYRKEDNMKRNKLTALYERLSKDDGDGENQESNSIATQKQILEQFAEQNGLTPYRYWTDDGFSGKDFERPSFQEMLAEIEKGNIGAVIVKTLTVSGARISNRGYTVKCTAYPGQYKAPPGRMGLCTPADGAFVVRRLWQ